jgi:hypothetical protein
VLALPIILGDLKSRGYRIVHVEPATPEHTKTATLPSQWLVPKKAIHKQARKQTRNVGLRM